MKLETTNHQSIHKVFHSCFFLKWNPTLPKKHPAFNNPTQPEHQSLKTALFLHIVFILALFIVVRGWGFHPFVGGWIISPKDSGVKHRKSAMIYWLPTFGWFYPDLFGAFSGSWYATLGKNILRNDRKHISVSLDEDPLVNACNMQEADKFKLTSLNINKLYKRYTRSVESLSVRFGGVDSGTALPWKAIWYE